MIQNLIQRSEAFRLVLKASRVVLMLYIVQVYKSNELMKNISVDQSPSIEKIEKICRKSDFEEFRSKRHGFAWILETLPKISATANILSQITAKTFQPIHITQLNKAIEVLKETPNCSLKFNKLDESRLGMVTFSGASFSNDADGSTQLGYIIILPDKYETENVLHFASYNDSY